MVDHVLAAVPVHASLLHVLQDWCFRFSACEAPDMGHPREAMQRHATVVLRDAQSGPRWWE